MNHYLHFFHSNQPFDGKCQGVLENLKNRYITGAKSVRFILVSFLKWKIPKAWIRYEVNINMQLIALNT